MATGVFPELHAWAADPKEQEIVDLSTGRFVEQCAKLIHEGWPGDRPPATFWGKAKDLPTSVVYRPEFAATAFAHRFAQDLDP